MGIVRRKVKLELDSDEIKKTVRDLKNLRKSIREIDKAIEKVLDQAVKYCISITPVSDKDGNHLIDNTYWEKTPTGYRVVQEGKHVAFVEFGTGEIGESKGGHPAGDTVDWKYASGKHIFTTKDGKKGWYYPTGELYTSMKTGKTSEVHKFTRGQIPHMQMWKTAEFIQEKLGSEVQYMIVKEVKKVGNHN